MYIALKNINKKVCYFLRESFFLNDELSFRDLFDLGSDPSDFIIYPGGNACYIDEVVEKALKKAGANFDYDMLEDLFWPWIRPDIKRLLKPSGTVHPHRLRPGSILRLMTRQEPVLKNQ